MRIRILAVGTRGDVQPYVALGLGLQAVGHDVRVITHAVYEAFVRGRGLDFAPLQDNPQAFIDRDDGPPANNPFNVMLRARKELPRHFEECLAGCHDAEVILASLFGTLAGHDIAEKLGIPFVPALTVPVSPTRIFPSYITPVSLDFGPVFNRSTYRLTDLVFWLYSGRWVNDARRRVLQLPATGYFRPRLGHSLLRQHPVVYGFSPTILSKPADWGDWNHITGYWFLERAADWQPPAALTEFLRAGPPPVYVGFGSMMSSMMKRSAEELTGVVLDALVRTKQRAVIEMGWAGLARADLPDGIFRIDGSVPHDWLFPQMGAAVHHAGVGTTCASLRAGIPTITVPIVSEASLWARRVANLGVGPRPLSCARLSGGRLADAIQRTLGDPQMRARAAALGHQMRQEDGVAVAVEVIQRLLNDRAAHCVPRPVKQKLSTARPEHA